MVPGPGKLSNGLYECTLCKKTFTGPASYVDHIKSEKHLKQSTSNTAPRLMSEGDNFIKCIPCETEISGMVNLEQHERGKKHKNAVAKREQQKALEREQAKLVSTPPILMPTPVHPASPALANAAVGTEYPKFYQPLLSTSTLPANSTSPSHNLIGSSLSSSTPDANHLQHSTPDLIGTSNPTPVNSAAALATPLQGYDDVQPVTTVSVTSLSLLVRCGPYLCNVCDKRFMLPTGYKEHSTSCTAVDNFISCGACNTVISGTANLNAHHSGKRHTRAMANLDRASAKAQDQPVTAMSVPHYNPFVLASVSTPPCSTSVLTLTSSGNLQRPMCQLGIGTSSSSLKPKGLGSDVFDVSGSEVSSTTKCVAVELQPPFHNGTSDRGGKADNVTNFSRGKNLEKGIASAHNGETEKKSPAAPNFVSVVYNEQGTMCKVGDYEGYACRKCRILLFEDAEAAECHYKMHSSPELMRGKEQ